MVRIKVFIFILSKLYEKRIWAGLYLYSRVTSYIWSLNTVMQGKVARLGAGEGGTQEAPSHSGGHAAWSRVLSRVYVAFRRKVNTRRVFLCIFSDMMRRPSLPSSLLPCSRVIDEGTECASCCLKQNTEKNKEYTFPLQWIGHIKIKGI